MRVTIDHASVRRGLVLKKTYYEVSLTVHFSHEEKQIIRSRGLDDTVLLQRRPADARVDDRDDKFELRTKHILHGQTDRFLTATPSHSKIYEERLIDAMGVVKLWLEDNAEMAARRIIEF